MKTVDLIRHKDRLDNLFQTAKQLSFDAELQSHWARYLCILVSGLIEQSVRTLLADFAQKVSHPAVARYVNSELNRFQNPTTQKILDVVGAFDLTWRSSLDAIYAGELKDSIDSVVANRNNLAHGRYVGLTLATMTEYYERIIFAIEALEQTCAN